MMDRAMHAWHLQAGGGGLSLTAGRVRMRALSLSHTHTRTHAHTVYLTPVLQGLQSYTGLCAVHPRQPGTQWTSGVAW